MKAGIVTVALAVVLGVSVAPSLPAQADLGNNDVLLTLKFKDRSFKEVAATIGRKVGFHIIIVDEAIAAETVTIDVEAVQWRTALDMVAEKTGCVITQIGTQFWKAERPPCVYFSGPGLPIRETIDIIAKTAGTKIIVDRDVQGSITIRRKNIPWRDALETACTTLGYLVVTEPEGILRVASHSTLRKELVTRNFHIPFLRPRRSYISVVHSCPPRLVHKRSIEGCELIAALRRIITPGLGSLEYSEDDNRLIVKDIVPVVREIASLIKGVSPAPTFIDVVCSPAGDVWDYLLREGIPERLSWPAVPVIVRLGLQLTGDPRARVVLLASTRRKTGVSIAGLSHLSELRAPEALMFLGTTDAPGGSVFSVCSFSPTSSARGELQATCASTIGVRLNIRYPIVVY